MGAGKSMAMQQGWDKGAKEDREAMEEFLNNQVKVGHDQSLGLAGGVWDKPGDGGEMEKYYDKHGTTPEDPAFEAKIMSYYEDHDYIKPGTMLIVLSTAFTYDQGGGPPALSQAIMFSQALSFMMEPLNKALKAAHAKEISFYNPNMYNNGHPGWCQVYKAMLNRAQSTGGFMIQPINTIAGDGFRATGKVKMDAKGQKKTGGSQKNEKDMAFSRNLPVYQIDLSTWMDNPKGWNGQWVEQINSLKLKLFILKRCGVPNSKLKSTLADTMFGWDMAMDFAKKDATTAWDRQYPQVEASKPTVLTG